MMSPAAPVPALPVEDPYLERVREHVRALPESGIVEVMNYGRDRPGMIPLWAGEGDVPTPPFICEAAASALHAGETFYTWQRGLPELRASIARYMSGLYGVPEAPERYFVTGSGMQAIHVAMALVAGAGDEVIIPSPTWPNAAAAAQKAGARAVYVPFNYGPEGFTLDHDRLAAAVTPSTRAIFLNTPANPTGFVATLDDLKAVLSLARRHGLWIIADEIYALFYYGGRRAPSFIDVAGEDDRILYVNSFSKNWAMTGWRVGWLKVPPSLQQVFENLIQYSTSGVAQFMQRGAVAALDGGDAFIDEQVARARQARDLVCGILGRTGRARFAVPQGAFYLFFSVDGIADSRQAAFDIVDHANVGLAPGTAFGEGWDAFFRLCFHRRLDQVEEAAERLARWIGTA